MENKVIIIIPTFNEKENLAHLLEKACSACREQKILPLFLIVDDNSPDGTGDLARELAGKYPLEIIQREGTRGIGIAYKEAFAYVFANHKPEYILAMDGDNSHDPKFFASLLNKASEGFDVVLGSRYINGGNITGWGFSRKLISRGANFLTSLVLKLNLADVTTGFRCYRAEALKKINLNLIKSDGFSFMEEILFYCRKAGLRIAEVPIDFIDRSRGESKLGLKDIIKVFTTIVRLRFAFKNEK